MPSGSVHTIKVSISDGHFHATSAIDVKEGVQGGMHNHLDLTLLALIHIGAPDLRPKNFDISYFTFGDNRGLVEVLVIHATT